MHFKERKKRKSAQFHSKVCYLSLKKIAIDKPSDKFLIEYYTSSLGPELAMFSKMSVNPTFSETYEEAERVEAEKESIEDYPEQSGDKTFGKKPLLLTKPKDERSQDFEGSYPTE